MKLHFGLQFETSRSDIYRALCERLEEIDHVTNAVECWQQMVSELVGNMDIHGGQANWVSGQELCLPSMQYLFDPHLIDFKQRCAKKLMCLGDAAVDVHRHDDALTKYSTTLLLDPADPQVLIKRSKVYATVGFWANALNDANQVHRRYVEPQCLM